MQISCSDFGVEQEISEFFTYFAPGHKFHPKVKAKIWDGRIRLFDQRRKTLYKGLLDVAIRFCKERKYEFEVDVSLKNSTNITQEEVAQFIDSLNLQGRGVKLTVRDYQYQAVFKSLESKRNLLVSPTSSGKSMMLYAKIRYHVDVKKHRILLIVPTTALVEQMFSDFEDYSSANGWNVEDNVQMLYSGKEKLFEKNVMISTWQSLTAMMKNQPSEFQSLVRNVDVALFDEAHQYKATAVLATMEKFIHTEWRTGTTGTLDNSKINELSLRGLMGPVFQVITTKELMDSGQVTELNIRAIVLKYPEEVRKAMSGMKYKEEIDYIIGSVARNKFIVNLANACVGNTLILFNFVDRHGAVLGEMLRATVKPGRAIYFISGSGTDVDEREEIRRLVETQKDSIIVATASLFSTGINIPSIENIIFAVPTKSTIRVRQSIGRGLRLKAGKNVCKLFDIVDDLRHKSYVNTTMKHFEERVKIYDAEQFQWNVLNVDLK